MSNRGEVRQPLVAGADGDESMLPASAFVQLAHPDERSRVRAAIEEAARSGEARGVEYCAEEDDDREWLETWFAVVAEDGPEPLLLGITHDISDRYRRIERLQRQSEHLAERSRGVAHDIRGPLNVANGRLALARQEHDSEHLADVADALDRMDELVDDLVMDVSGRTGPDDREQVSVREVAASCWRTVAPGDADLQVLTDQTIVADPGRLKQILENLLGNAVEHGRSTVQQGRNGHPADPVQVTVGSIADGFYVADDGPGIPTDERDAVFRSGYSGHPDGTGFGLDIVRRAAEAQGWTVAISERDTGGARFEVTGVDVVGDD